MGGVGLAMDRPSRGRRATAWLYVRYVRSVYYEQEHPVRFNAVSAVFMALILWLAFRNFGDGMQQSAWFEAVECSAIIAAIRSWQAHRPKTLWRFRRWATKHPTPEQLADPAFVDAMLGRRPLPSGAALLRWCGWTLLSFVIAYILIGFVVDGMIPGGSGQVSPVGPIVALACGMPAVVLMRLYWPPLRDWPRSVPELGWYPDPAGRHEFRAWDGSRWTEQVADHGTRSVDPIE